MSYIFFFTTPVPPQIYSLSLHDALPISRHPELLRRQNRRHRPVVPGGSTGVEHSWTSQPAPPVTAVLTERLRSEEHTSELQSRGHLVCRLLLEKKKKINNIIQIYKLEDR